MSNVLASVERSDDVERYVVTENSIPARTIWRVATPLGPVWLQSVLAEVPGL